MAGAQIAYNPDDPLQQGFLASIIEAGNLSGLPADQTALASVANEYGINLNTTGGENEALWDVAQQQYGAATGGSLEAALAAPSQFSGIQNALAFLWPSVLGSAGAPQGLADQLEANISGNAVSSASAPAAGTTTTPEASSGLTSWFQRGGLLIVGALVILVGLWALLAKQGVVPGVKFGG